MYTWTSFPFVRLAGAAVAGILCFEAYPKWWDNSISVFSVLGGAFLFFWFLWVVLRWKRLSFLAGLSGLVWVAFSFGWITSGKNALADPLHWRHTQGRIQAFEGRIISDVLEKSTTRRYTVEVFSLVSADSGRRVTGQLHLYVKRDSASVALRYGDRVRVLASPTEIPPPTNPEEFNYSAYVARQQVHGQCFVNPEKVSAIGHLPKYRWMGAALELRAYLKEKVEAYVPNEDARAIALALLIGVKDFLSEDLKTAYASAGAMHVLAVSGLHVGILYMLVVLFLKPLERRKGGHIALAVISIFIIWVYTFVTGMSPSVLRAATMFSIMATSKAVLRKSNIYNSLGLSAFILLLFDPNLLFQVGFQLSYLAVVGIVYLQPRIYRWLYVRNKWLDKVWVITAVSIAAQVATLPLTIYYFNQFPTYFFLSNLVVIPGATIIMVGGIAMLVLGSISNGLGFVLGWAVNGVIWLMNYLVTWVEQIPGSLITWLYFDDFQVWMVYGILIVGLMAFHLRSGFYLSLCLLSCCLVFGWGHWREYQRLRTDRLIIYDIQGTTALDWIKGKDATLFIEDDARVDHELLRFQIDPFRRANGLEPYESTLHTFYPVQSTDAHWKMGLVANHKVLVLDEPLEDQYLGGVVTTDLLIIQNESVRSVNWLVKNFHFKEVIIGSDNSWRYSRRVSDDLSEQGVRVHSLLLDGSWQKPLRPSEISRSSISAQFP